MIRDAVASVLAQDYRPIEIIVIDDGSTDTTLSVVEAMAAEFPGVIQVSTQENLGPGAAREQGRRKAKGEFIQYLDSDDLLMPDKFSVQVNLLRENPGCGVAYGVTRLVDMNGQVIKHPYKWTGSGRVTLFPGLLVDRWWCTHTPLYRRVVCDAVGAWSNLRYSQDWEYDARVGALGTRLISTTSLVSEHRAHGNKRQTGHGNWLEPEDQLKFFKTLYNCAQLAGVDNPAPEMRHFTRWVFSRARDCGAQGDSLNSKALFNLAMKSSNDKIQLQVYCFLAGVFGWNMMGQISRIRDLLSKGRSSEKSLKQSWMN